MTTTLVLQVSESLCCFKYPNDYMFYNHQNGQVLFVPVLYTCTGISHVKMHNNQNKNLKLHVDLRFTLNTKQYLTIM